jgi:hypothetical protein
LLFLGRARALLSDSGVEAAAVGGKLRAAHDRVGWGGGGVILYRIIINGTNVRLIPRSHAAASCALDRNATP